MKFWTWLRKKAEEKERKQSRADYRCPRCLTWQSNCEGPAEFREGMTKMLEMHLVMKCGKCSHTSYWFAGSIIPILVTPQFNPTNLPDTYVSNFSE